MKTEFLVIVSNDDCFCCDENALINFLQSDTLLTIKNTKVKKIVFKRPDEINTIVRANLTIITNTLSSNKERYFLITLENNANNEADIDLFSELSDRTKNTLNRLCSEKSEKVTINTLWDDVGRYYAEKSYPIINEVENLMRKLITMFLTINVGINWVEQIINKDLLKEIKKVDDIDKNLNDLYKLDFIKLANILFDPWRETKIDQLERILRKTNFTKNDQHIIKGFISKSTWERFFINKINIKQDELKKKWALLYDHRCKIAHNRYITQRDFKEIKGISSTIINSINDALKQIDQIQLNDIEKDNIIQSYIFPSYQEYIDFTYSSIKAFYRKQRQQVIDLSKGYDIDFIHLKDNNLTGEYIPIGVSIYISDQITMSYIEEKIKKVKEFIIPTYYSAITNLDIFFISNQKNIELINSLEFQNNMDTFLNENMIINGYKTIEIIFGYIDVNDGFYSNKSFLFKNTNSSSAK